MKGKFLKVLILPITIIGFISIIFGALGLGYSFFTIIINHDYVETTAKVVEEVNDAGRKEVSLVYSVDDKTYQGYYPFIGNKAGQEKVIGYNPERPSSFHVGDLNSHFTYFVWGAFLLMFGLVVKVLMRQVKLYLKTC